MSRSLSDALPDLPLPEVIEELDFEIILQRRKALVIETGDALGLNLRDYLERDFEVGSILLEDASYAEMLVRSRINTVYRSRLLYFAKGSDLDHVADRRGESRLPGESDEDLIERTRIRVRGSSAAGPDDWWRSKAMGADERVEDVAVTRVGVGQGNQERGLVELAVLAQSEDGVASEQLLEKVRRAVSNRAVRPLGSSVRVVAATTKAFSIHARIWLLPDAGVGVFEGLEGRLRAGFAKVRSLGFDIAPSWVAAQLQAPGVQRVELLGFDAPLIVSNAQAPRMEEVDLELMGIQK
jgi:phage-related baseplate assembly protein